MKEQMKPIIMSTEDVLALLDGRKTMVRVPIKHQPDKSAQFMRISCGRACFETDIDMWNIMLPHQPGDVLWVRETWGDYGGQTSHYIYRADYPLSAKGYWHEKEHINWCDFPKWNSPVTMPREAARLFLRVKDVRVEKNKDSGQWEWVYEFERAPSGAIGPEPDGTAPNGDKGVEQ